MKLAPSLADFSKLQRLYYGSGTTPTKRSLRAQDAFHDSNRTIAKKSKTIEQITDINHSPFYLSTKIKRNEAGEVEEVIPMEGYGMIVCSEDDAFPRGNL